MCARPQSNTLKAAMLGMAGEAQREPATEQETVGPQQQPRPPSRAGKRIVSAYVNADAARQLRMLGVELDSSTQSLIEEALNDLFRKHSKSAIA